MPTRGDFNFIEPETRYKKDMGNAEKNKICRIASDRICKI
jgi:hypothetical protein